VRKSVGELEPLYKQLDDKSTEFSHLTEQRKNIRFVTLTVGALGLVFALGGLLTWQLSIVGIIFLAGAAMFAFLTFNDNSEKIKDPRIRNIRVDRGYEDQTLLVVENDLR
jgi:Ca2+/Na+ antiporter